ncbi:hypothetical protein DX926_09285 [Bacillus atrophaeus]|nr:hypothetical protein DX926_09285 [Bacillus atrophaeus]
MSYFWTAFVRNDKLLLGFLGSYIASSFSEMLEARRGQTASVELAADHQSDVYVERRGHTA